MWDIHSSKQAVKDVIWLKHPSMTSLNLKHVLPWRKISSFARIVHAEAIDLIVISATKYFIRSYQLRTEVVQVFREKELITRHHRLQKSLQGVFVDSNYFRLLINGSLVLIGRTFNHLTWFANISSGNWKANRLVNRSHLDRKFDRGGIIQSTERRLNN